MDPEEYVSKHPQDPASLLARQDLDPLSIEELTERIALLETEIVRTRARISQAVNHRASAEALFRK